MTNFEDPWVQIVYNILVDCVEPPEGEHWEGFVARQIVSAIEKELIDELQAWLGIHK